LKINLNDSLLEHSKSFLFTFYIFSFDKMITEPLTDLFEGGGLMITPNSNRKIIDLNYNEIVSLFERYGVLLFRGFDLKTNEITEVTDVYTERYAVDATRRAKRFNQSVVRDVDYHNIEKGDSSVLLHSEASFTPAWPEIIWFYCHIPPKDGGNTILCDGVKLWEKLSVMTQDIFLSEPVRYELKIPIAKKRPGKGKRPWVSRTPGLKGGIIDWNTGLLHTAQLRYAVQEGRSTNNLCFANHLIVTLESEPQLTGRTMSSGLDIPENIMDEILYNANQLTYDHKWQKGDYLMIDNKRMMHGRREIQRDDPRDIVVIQTAKASFGFGCTTRKSLIS